MSPIKNQSTASNSNATDRLTDLSAEMDGTLRSARTGAVTVVVLSLLGIVLTGSYLRHAHGRLMRDLSPELASDYSVAYLDETLPALTPQFKQQVIDFAPHALDLAEQRLSEIPDKFADSLLDNTARELDKLTPQAESDLLKALKHALVQARDARGPGVSDEAHIRQLLDTLGDTYEERSIQLIDDVRARYTTTGANILGYLDFLATNKGLDPKQSLQRQALVNFLTIASRARG